MGAEDGGLAAALKPGPRMQALWRGALDLVFPPQALDGGRRPMAGGLTAETWSRIHFLDGAGVRRLRATSSFAYGSHAGGMQA